MPPLYGAKEIMKYLKLRSQGAFYDRIKIGLPVCKICGRIESSTELIDEWRITIVRKQINKGKNSVIKHIENYMETV